MHGKTTWTCFFFCTQLSGRYMNGSCFVHYFILLSYLTLPYLTLLFSFLWGLEFCRQSVSTYLSWVGRCNYIRYINSNPSPLSPSFLFLWNKWKLPFAICEASDTVFPLVCMCGCNERAVLSLCEFLCSWVFISYFFFDQIRSDQPRFEMYLAC